MVDVANPAGQRVFDGDHAQGRLSAGHGGEGVLEGRARQRLVLRQRFLASEVAVRAGVALKRDFHGCASLIVIALDPFAPSCARIS
jgi:hypothetical protein